MNDPRKPRLPGEISQLFDEQMTMLADRCEAFYDGKNHEAKSASGILYVLLHDHGKSAKSLLTQLGLKEKTKFLDSRVRDELTINSARGAWPRTCIPYKQYREKDLYSFDAWWNGQPFHILRKDIVFTRKELVETIRHREGGGHVAPQTEQRIAQLKRTRSPWRRSIKENEDGSTHVYVGIDLSNSPVPDDSDQVVMNDYELASVCAIAEEVLFSLTPEPDNRKRMHDEEWQKPFYLTPEESDACKDKIREDLERLEAIPDLERGKEIFVTIAKATLQNVMNLDCLNAEDYAVRRGVAYQLRQGGIDWPDPD